MQPVNFNDIDDVMLWADGTWCYRSELEHMTYMSDDYEVIRFGSQKWNDLMMAHGASDLDELVGIAA